MKRLLAVLLLLGSVSVQAAVCTVTEHAAVPIQAGNAIQVPTWPPLREEAVTFTVNTAVTNPFTSTTRYIGIVCDAKAYFEVAADGTATATTANAWIPADVWFFINVPAGFEIAFYDGVS